MNSVRETREVVVRRWNNETRKMNTVKTCMIELTIDIDGLFSSIGQSAAQNKTGKSVEASGYVVAKVVK